MDCRSKERRQRIVANYEVRPVAHLQLLQGQTKYSDAKKMIHDQYYVFEAKNKTTGEIQTIQCGMGAARDFLRLINHSGLPLFNPLCQQNNERRNENIEIVRHENEHEKDKWDPVAKQLYHAIMWIIVLIDAKPNTTIFEIKDKVYQYRRNKPFPSNIKSVNTILKGCFRGVTLTEKIDQLTTQNRFRKDVCQFDLLIKEMNNMKDKEENSISSFF